MSNMAVWFCSSGIRPNNVIFYWSGEAQLNVRWPLIDLLLPSSGSGWNLHVSASSPSSCESKEPLPCQVSKQVTILRACHVVYRLCLLFFYHHVYGPEESWFFDMTEAPVYPTNKSLTSRFILHPSSTFKFFIYKGWILDIVDIWIHQRKCDK